METCGEATRAELILEIMGGETESSLTNAGNIRWCEEETGRVHRFVGPGVVDSRVDARRHGITCRGSCGCRTERARFCRCGRRHAHWHSHSRLSVWLFKRRWA